MRRYLFLLIVLFISFGITSQEVVSGLVVDAENNQPLPGVSISVKNSSVGTSTDLNGNYMLSVPPDVQFLTFSYVGMLTREVKIEDQKVINVALEHDIFSLDGVVVTAIGITKQKKHWAIRFRN